MRVNMKTTYTVVIIKEKSHMMRVLGREWRNMKESPPKNPRKGDGGEHSSTEGKMCLRTRETTLGGTGGTRLVKYRGPLKRHADLLIVKTPEGLFKEEE